MDMATVTIACNFRQTVAICDVVETVMEWKSVLAKAYVLCNYFHDTQYVSSPLNLYLAKMPEVI